jgi:hypothetical protein
MFQSISRLLTALSRLAGTVEELAGTVAEVNASLRSRLTLEQADQPAALDHEPAPEGGGNGRRKRQAT